MGQGKNFGMVKQSRVHFLTVKHFDPIVAALDKVPMGVTYPCTQTDRMTT